MLNKPLTKLNESLPFQQQKLIRYLLEKVLYSIHKINNTPFSAVYTLLS